MKLNFMPPALVFVLSKLPEGCGGCANGPVVSGTLGFMSIID